MKQSESDSFLGINFKTLRDGQVQLTQKQLLEKILKKCPTIKRHSKISHPYAAESSKLKGNESSPVIDRNKYLSLLGLLMFMTKSRPDILAACSFAATKSKEPREANYENMLCIVHQLRITEDKGLILKTIESPNFEPCLCCEVEASYLLHEDSKGHTGYCIGFGQVGFFHFRSQKYTLAVSLHKLRCEQQLHQ